jgi:hypothetical protein
MIESVQKKAATLKNLTLFLKFLKINSNHRVTEYENLNPTKLEALNSKLQTVFYELFRKQQRAENNNS